VVLVLKYYATVTDSYSPPYAVETDRQRLITIPAIPRLLNAKS